MIAHLRGGRRREGGGKEEEGGMKTGMEGESEGEKRRQAVHVLDELLHRQRRIQEGEHGGPVLPPPPPGL